MTLSKQLRKGMELIGRKIAAEFPDAEIDADTAKVSMEFRDCAVARVDGVVRYFCSRMIRPPFPTTTREIVDGPSKRVKQKLKRYERLRSLIETQLLAAMARHHFRNSDIELGTKFYGQYLVRFSEVHRDIVDRNLSTQSGKMAQNVKANKSNHLTEEERELLGAAVRELQAADGMKQISAATRVALQLSKGEFPGIARRVEKSAQTLAGYTRKLSSARGG